MISISKTKRNHQGQGLGNTGDGGGGGVGERQNSYFSFFKNAVTSGEALPCRRRICLRPVAGHRF